MHSPRQERRAKRMSARWQDWPAARCAGSAPRLNALWPDRLVRQRFLVAEVLAHIDLLDETIERLSAEIAERERLLRWCWSDMVLSAPRADEVEWLRRHDVGEYDIRAPVQCHFTAST